MNLHFPHLCGGTVNGLNDAGIETFEGDFAQNVIRECAQNSLDAADPPGAQVTVSVQRVSLNSQDLPFISNLREVLIACRTEWQSHRKAVKFFNAALASINSNHIDALRISDFGTTGVDGTDEDNTGRWFGLVKSRGVSNHKGAESGGAFGIGKDAPLAGSSVRTVLYSTRTAAGNVAFQGVCRLVTHRGQDGELTQGTGFIGEFDAEQRIYRAIRTADSIPERFLRTAPGLDVWILGSRHLHENWAQPFIRSALANFWPAIAEDKISFEIGDKVVNKSNLGISMRTERFDKQVEKSWPFYQSLVDPHAKTYPSNLPIAGECALHLLVGKRDLPKRICMVRGTGMVIDTFAPRVGFIPFAGLFVCMGHKGNELLRSLEPPRHDKWDASRSDGPEAAQALAEIKDWIKNILKNQTPHAGEDQFNESEVPPDLLEDAPENPIIEPDSENEPDLGGNPKDASPPQKVTIRTRPQRKTKDPGKQGTHEGSSDTDAPEKGDGKSTGGRKGQQEEGSGSSSVTPRIPSLSTRAFTPSDNEDVVELVLRANGEYQGNVWIEGIGDDGSSTNLALDSAELVGIGPADVEQNKIKNLLLSVDQPVRLRIQLKQPGKYSIRAALS